MDGQAVRGWIGLAPIRPASAISAMAYEQSAIRKIMDSADLTGFDERADEYPVPLFGGKIHWRGAPSAACDLRRIDRLAQMPFVSPMRTIASAAALEGMVACLRTSSKRPTRAMVAGQNADALGLVIERDIARDDRHVKRAGGLADAPDRAHQLAHDGGPLGVSEV